MQGEAALIEAVMIINAHGAILANTLVERNVAICAWRYTASQSNLGCVHDHQTASRPPAMLSNAGKEGVEIGGAHVSTTDTNAHSVCRVIVEKNKTMNSY